jgi:hypothetical protein
MRDMKTRIVFCVLNTMYPHEYKTLASPVSSPRLRVHACTRARASFAIARRVARAPDARPRARRRAREIRVDAPTTRASTSRTSRRRRQSRETTRERIYPKLTVDDRFDARERRAIRAMREDAS